MEDIVTPVDPDAFENLLLESNYEPEETNFIVSGFRFGFTLGYDVTHKVQVRSQNLRLTIGDHVDLWNKVMKEVKLKWYAGPFADIPDQYQDDFIQLPIGLVTKDNGKDTRLIFHLSHPRSKNSTSVNANTPKNLCSVKYPDFSDAVQMLNTILDEAGQCFIGKSDAKSAFRNLSILKKFLRYLIMKARSPLDGKWYYFVDKCLPFGVAISCLHFQHVSDGIAHIIRFKTGKDLINYLDDFLFAAYLRALCDQQIQTFLDVCKEIGMHISLEKTFWADTSLTFLGLLLDTILRIVGVLCDKLAKGRNMIQTVLDKECSKSSKRKMTIIQLQRICGFLNFLS